jgi:hypothetical protein
MDAPSANNREKPFTEAHVRQASHCWISSFALSKRPNGWRSTRLDPALGMSEYCTIKRLR